jgi:hypothetical protein
MSKAHSNKKKKNKIMLSTTFLKIWIKRFFLHNEWKAHKNVKKKLFHSNKKVIPGAELPRGFGGLGPNFPSLKVFPKN